MRFADMLNEIDNSSPDEWLKVYHPVFKQYLGLTSGGGAEPGIHDILEHDSVYTLSSNLSISIQTGLTHLDRFHADWAERFPDEKASSDYVDFCWNGNVVYRDVRVIVDGGRAGLPVPRFETTSVSRLQSSIWRLIDSMSGSSDYDRFFSMAGLTEVDEPWPRN